MIGMCNGEDLTSFFMDTDRSNTVDLTFEEDTLDTTDDTRQNDHNWPRHSDNLWNRLSFECIYNHRSQKVSNSPAVYTMFFLNSITTKCCKMCNIFAMIKHTGYMPTCDC